MISLSNVFKAYDIRGIVPDQLNAEQFRAIGMAVARYTGAPTLLVARDMRDSGIELSRAFADGARSEGARVIDLGLASTDLLYFAAGRLDAPGAMFTASHNPGSYNGFKYKPEYAGSAPPEIVEQLEANIDASQTEGAPKRLAIDEAVKQATGVRPIRPVVKPSAGY